MSGPRHIAVIDIGKTNAKLALVDRATLAEITVLTTPNRFRAAPPYPHADTGRLWAFLRDGLARLHAAHGVDAIVPVCHGACAALLAADGSLAAPVLDYEHPGPEETSAAYDALRPPFAQTGSPRLPLGLNLGAQIHWQLDRDPSLIARIASVVTWPQYWSHRLTGVAATDASSLGTHTDLWDVAARDFSDLPARLGLAGRIARPRPPGEILGPILPRIAAETGLAPGTPVACGIHDSNASLLPYLLIGTPPFTVVSTGTWFITMAVGGRRIDPDPARDTLINVNAFGEPVPSARFMGGREHDLIRKSDPTPATPEAAAEVLRRKVMLLPAVDPQTGPFRGRAMGWTVPEADLAPETRGAALCFYLAMMTAECAAITGARGPTVVEGPFAGELLYLRMLAAATGREVLVSKARTGTAIGAALLFEAEGTRAPLALQPAPAPPPEEAAALKDYADRWRALARATRPIS